MTEYKPLPAKQYADVRAENEKLKERIEKAKVTFFEIGSDAGTAVNMYNILTGE